METGLSETGIFNRNFISVEKCVLLDTMYVILHVSLQDTSVFTVSIHRNSFVTGLYLDKH